MKRKYLDLKEFHQKGLLQEVNRQFFHPIGLALEMSVDTNTGEMILSGVWDYRDDPEGIYFADPPSIGGQIYVEILRNKHEKARKNILNGKTIQPTRNTNYGNEYPRKLKR